jgi:serralysin
MLQTYEALLVSNTTGWHNGSGTITYTYLGNQMPSYYQQTDTGWNVSGDGVIAPFGQSFSMTTEQRAMNDRAIQAWNEVANVNLQSGTIAGSTVGDIAFGAAQFSDPTLFGFVSGFPAPGQLGNTASAAGDMWINSANTSQFVPGVGPIFGHTSWNTYLHELGHAIGLRHPNESPNDQATNNQFTVMSYIPHPGVASESLLNQGFGLTPMVWDIQAVQQLYGANTTTRTGNTVYFGDGNGQGEQAYQYGANNMMVRGEDNRDRPVILAIWDAGGTDLIDASDLSTNSRIDLTPGAYSTIGSIENNIGLAAAVMQNGQTINFIENAWGGSGNDQLGGNAANNELRGNGGADTLTGGDGDDTLAGGAGDDQLDGGAGTRDQAAFDVNRADATITVNGNTITVASSEGTDILTGIEFLAFADQVVDASNPNGGGGSTTPTQGNDVLTGTEAADQLGALDGDDSVSGLGGNDTLYGGPGNDTLLGGAGDDLLGAGTGNDSLEGGDGRDAVFTAAGNDTAHGGDGNDTLGGATGNDSLLGGLGDDQLWGAADNDTLEGGAGADTLGGSSGDDSLSGGDGNDEMWGSIGNDTSFGGAGADTLGGAAGNDSLSGDAGADELWGSLGDDTLDGGDDNDQVGAGAGNDRASGGAGDDQVFGGAGNDTLFGNDGNDTIYGASGDDVINGGDGNDQMFAGPGEDVIIFSNGTDRAEFFSAVDDVVDLSGVAAITDAADLQANHASEIGGSTVIDDGLGNTLTLVGVAIADLDGDNFLF